MKKKLFIVKVQLPLRTNEPEPKALFYDETRDIWSFLPIDKPLKKAMGGADKKFFYATMKGAIIHLEEEAPWQDW